MKLILIVTSQQHSAMGQDSQHVFDVNGGSIGRSHESNWVLPDTNLIVSKRHATIDFREGSFYLTDTSTNGVFLNDSDQPIGYNNAVRIREGDRLAIGEFRIRVDIELSERYYTPLIQNDPPHLIDSVVSQSGLQAQETSEPLPLGLNHEDGLWLESRSSLPMGWGSVEMGSAATPASQPNHAPAINDAFSAPAAHIEQLPEDWNKVVVKTGDEERISPQQRSCRVDSVIQSAQYQTERLDSRSEDRGKDTPVHDGTGISEFLRGVGIDPVNIHSENFKLTLEQLGSLYREMVAGVMDVLIARSSLKNEFRMTHTIVRATENNPLKFSVGVDNALECLFFKKGEGFLKPEDAFREAYQDIKEHQFATVVGMRSAFNALVRMFEPKHLQSGFKKGSKRKGFLSRNTNAENWKLYEKWYSELLTDTDDHFQQLFAAEFGRAYEEEIQRLTATRKKDR